MVTTTTKNQSTEALSQLEKGIKNLILSDNWAKYLRMQSQFHQYSFNNCLLIMMQCPKATKVAGYHSWVKMNRHVCKGEKAIKILAPLINKNEDKESILLGFKTVSVFDINQTEGEDLPTVIKPLSGDDNGLLEKLIQLATSKKIKVKIEHCEFNGYCRYEETRPVEIVINSRIDPLHRAKTMVHELAHAILHTPDEYRKHRGDRELEAESVAFCVLNYFGLDSSDYSFGYIAQWQKEAEKDLNETLEQLKASAGNIQRALKEIIEFVNS